MLRYQGVSAFSGALLGGVLLLTSSVAFAQTPVVKSQTLTASESEETTAESNAYVSGTTKLWGWASAPCQDNATNLRWIALGSRSYTVGNTSNESRHPCIQFGYATISVFKRVGSHIYQIASVSIGGDDAYVSSTVTLTATKIGSEMVKYWLIGCDEGTAVASCTDTEPRRLQTTIPATTDTSKTFTLGTNAENKLIRGVMKVGSNDTLAYTNYLDSETVQAARCNANPIPSGCRGYVEPPPTLSATLTGDAFVGSTVMITPGSSNGEYGWVLFTCTTTTPTNTSTECKLLTSGLHNLDPSATTSYTLPATKDGVDLVGRYIVLRVNEDCDSSIVGDCLGATAEFANLTGSVQAESCNAEPIPSGCRGYVAPPDPLMLAKKSDLNDSTQPLAVGATDVSLDLGDATGGQDGAAKTYTLTRTAGAANLAALGLQIQQTGTGPITITNAPGGTVAGNITLTYEVSDTSAADTDSFSLSINVTAEPAVRIDGNTRQTVESGNGIEAIALSALNFSGDITYVLVEVIDGQATGSSGNPLHGLRVTPNETDDKRATLSGTPARNISFVVRASAGNQTDDSETISITITSGATPPPSAPAAASGGGSGGAVAAIVIAAGAYFWWKKRQIASGNAAAMAFLPDVDFDLDRNDRRAFYTRMNWQNLGNSNWQIRSNLALHTKYDGELLDWNANSHIGYRLNGKFGEINPYLRGKFVQNAPENAEMRKTYSFGLNYAIPNRFSVQIVQPARELARFSLKAQVYLPKGISFQLNQPNSDLENYGFGVQWRGKSKIRYGISGETGNNTYRFTGEFGF